MSVYDNPSPDEPLEALVWGLARDARDLRERVEFGVKLEGKIRFDVAMATMALRRALEINDMNAEAAE